MVSLTRWNVGLAGLVSITLTLSETWLETHTSSPSGRTPTETGSTPTLTLAMTEFVPVLITDTVPLVVLAT
jgi:hypothetical protein